MLVLDRKISLVVLGGALLLYWDTFSYDPEIVAFPRFLLYVCFGLCVLLFAFPRQAGAYKAGIIYSREKMQAIALLIAYIVIFPIVGYFVTTFIFAILYLWIYRRKGLLGYTIYSVVFAGIMYFVFEKWLYIWFPQGLLF